MTPAQLHAAIDEVAAYLDRFVFFQSVHQLFAVALWVVNTYTFDQCDICPYLAISSPEKRSGKSLLLDVMKMLVARPQATANISAAAMFRFVEQEHPTLLFDETDAIFGKRASPDTEVLRGLINAGFQRGTPATRLGGANRTTLQHFDTYCPKALAGIGELPDTIADRSIPIRLQRKPRSVIKHRFRLRVEKERAPAIRARLEKITADLEIGNQWPDLPDELSDRAQDIWEPLLTIADLAEGAWPARARAAAVALHTAGDDAEGSIGIRLLADIRTVFADNDRLHTADLLNRLYALEEAPWSDWFGRPISDRWMADKLRPYGVHSKDVRLGDVVRKGYEKARFRESWNTYLPPIDATTATTATSGTLIDESAERLERNKGQHAATIEDVAARSGTLRQDGNAETPMVAGVVADVAPVAAHVRENPPDDLPVPF